VILDIFGSCVGESSDMSFLAEMRIARVMFVWPLMLITFVKFFRENEVFLCLGVGDGVVYSSTNQSN
jgi:hypothetical protein